MEKFFLASSALSGFISVLLGAFGAHALKNILDEYFMKVFHTGVEYQFYHTFALALVGLAASRYESPLLKYAGIAFLVGIILFSGSLYLLAFTKTKAWGAVTPIGGVSFLLGWGMMFIALMRKG
jgi:uncharacterized membrane protein YgdD (TMEM256/DUF423 family)